MRRFLRFACPAVMPGLLLMSCSSAPEDRPAEDDMPITIGSPVTVSSNYLFPYTGKDEYLRIKLVQGRYCEDWSPGPIMGTVWEGEFVAELADGCGNPIAVTDLNRFHDEPLVFTSHFQLAIDDYNGDGDADFTIGQYASGNGRSFRIFTLRESGAVEELPVGDHAPLFVSVSTDDQSTMLEKVDPDGFKIVHCDMSAERYVERFFRWDGEAFVLTGTREFDR